MIEVKNGQLRAVKIFGNKYRKVNRIQYITQFVLTTRNFNIKQNKNYL